MPDLPPLVPRAPHGGPSSDAFTGLDFSVNVNPAGPTPFLVEVVRRADHAHYPDPTYRDVRRSLARWHGVSPDQIALGVGASDLLHRLARSCLSTGDVLLSLLAPFGELARAARLQRAEIRITDRLGGGCPPRTRLLYVGQPHNPTGRHLSQEALEDAAATCARAGAWLVLDLAYAPFVDVPVLRHPAVIALHSPGKAHGLVGARPAYAVASAEVAARLDNLAPAWHLPAGTAALLAHLPEAQPFLSGTLEQVGRGALALADALRALGQVEHHGTPYLTLEVGDGARVAGALLARGIRVRNCASYGLPRCIRVSTQGAAADARLVSALQEVIHG